MFFFFKDECFNHYLKQMDPKKQTNAINSYCDFPIKNKTAIICVLKMFNSDKTAVIYLLKQIHLCLV